MGSNCSVQCEWNKEKVGEEILVSQGLLPIVSNNTTPYVQCQESDQCLEQLDCMTDNNKNINRRLEQFLECEDNSDDQVKSAIMIQRVWRKHIQSRIWKQNQLLPSSQKSFHPDQKNNQMNLDQKTSNYLHGFSSDFEDMSRSMHITSSSKFHKLIKPAYRFPNGSIYEGQWLGSCRDGHGVMTWPDGTHFAGQWRQNHVEGKGKISYATGDCYSVQQLTKIRGDWSKNQANGYGTYISTTGVIYRGEWMNDLMHGEGEQTFPGGKSYKGNFFKGLKHGYGRFNWPGGSYYEGNWENDVINGWGKFIWEDGRGYAGQWSNGMMNGQGTYTWPDGRKYVGEYLNDQKNGFGIYYWTDGKVYEGYWLYGKQEGEGKLKLVNGQVVYGFWQNGKLLKQKTRI